MHPGKTTICSIITVLVMYVPAYASRDYAASYMTEYGTVKGPARVYKSIDDTGRVTYSSEPPFDSMRVEVMHVESRPDPVNADATERRHHRIAAAAEKLAAAREAREAQRAEAEKQRLERMALLNQARRPRVYERNIFIGRPFKPWWTWPGGHHPHRPHPTPLPSSGQHPSHMSLPPSSFRGTGIGFR